MKTPTKSSSSPIKTLTRALCALIFLAAAALVILNIFGAITLSINVGILAALTAIAIVAIYSAFHLFWAGLFFLTAVIITIMNANALVFSLGGAQIGSLYIAAGLLTIAFHIMFKKSTFALFASKDADANFGTSVKYFKDEFSSARLECNFGGIKAYFDGAKLKDSHATLDIECNFGSVELHVPGSWKVVDTTRTSFATNSEKNHPSTTDNSPTLTLTGEVNFGSIITIYG